jgi:G3E family GTPase
MKPALYLINGPLGAGKTTFLKQLLRTSGFTNARIIENEFASTSIDSQQLHDHTAEVQTIAGVCICCGSGEELVEALTALAESSEPVVIEATGVANSLKLIEKMAVADIFSRYTLAHGIFVLDGVESTPEALDTYSDELRAADTVLISKTDLMSDSQRRTLHQQLQKHGITRNHTVDNGVCDFSLLEKPSEMLDYFADFEGVIAAHDTDINYVVLTLDDWQVEPKALQDVWTKLRDTYGLRRMKGDIASPDGNYWHIEATPSQCRVTQGREIPVKLVCIGANARLLSVDRLKELCQ